MPTVTIGIVSFNALDTLKKSLELHEKYTPRHVKLIVFDNKSDEKLRDYLRENKRIDVLHLNHINSGFASANNAIMAMSDADILILMNPDIFVYEGWLEKWIMEYHKIKRLDDKIGALGCKNILPNGNICHEGICFVPHKHGVEPKNISNLQYPDVERRFEAQAVSFSSILLPKHIYKNYHLDEKFGRGFFEDVDYSLNLRQKGYTIWYTPFVSLTHKMHSSWNEAGEDKINAESDKNLRYFNEKWQDSRVIVDNQEWFRRVLY